MRVIDLEPGMLFIGQGRDSPMSLLILNINKEKGEYTCIWSFHKHKVLTESFREDSELLDFLELVK